VHRKRRVFVPICRGFLGGEKQETPKWVLCCPALEARRYEPGSRLGAYVCALTKQCIRYMSPQHTQFDPLFGIAGRSTETECSDIVSGFLLLLEGDATSSGRATGFSISQTVTALMTLTTGSRLYSRRRNGRPSIRMYPQYCSRCRIPRNSPLVVYPASGIVGPSRSHPRGVSGWSSHGICHSNTGLQISLEASQLYEGFAGVLRAKLGYKAAAELRDLSRCPRRVN
jgi:hypothetical protein